MLKVLEHLGFGKRWRNWIAAILSTASTKILFNGVLGRRIFHGRVLHQGDPVSLILFVVVMEFLNWMVH